MAAIEYYAIVMQLSERSIDWQQQWGLQIIIEFEGNQETDLDDDDEDSL